MSKSRRATLILVLVLAGLCVFAYSGWLHAGKWQTKTDSSISRAYGNPQAFAPLYAPDGNWQVFIDGPASIRKPLADALKRDLAAVNVGLADIELVTAIPTATAGVNRLIVTLTPDGTWTPVVGTFRDKGEVSIITAGESVPSDSLTVVSGMVKIDADYEAAGKGYGLIGRSQMNAYRAQIAEDFIIKAIRETYDEIRAKGH